MMRLLHRINRKCGKIVLVEMRNFAMIRYASLEDVEKLLELDAHIDSEELSHKIELERVLILEEDQEIIGWLRYGMFWDQIPFINYLYINKTHRLKGYGFMMLSYFETEMMARGHLVVMTAMAYDNDAQHFFRKFEYFDSGNFVIPGENLELIFVKTLER